MTEQRKWPDSWEWADKEIPATKAELDAMTAKIEYRIRRIEAARTLKSSERGLTDEQVKHMANRFLGWKLEISGDWLIWHDPLPINSRKADWCFVHKDFTRDNEDIRIGREESREMCLQTIDFIEDMEAQSREEATQDQVDKLMKRFWEIALVHDLARALKNVIDDPTGRGFMTGVHIQAAKTVLARYREIHLENAK